MTGEDLAAASEDSQVVKSPRGLPILGAVIALAVSGGLFWWLAAPHDDGSGPTPAARSAPKAAIHAPAQPDPAQVRQAFQAVQDAYADGGPDGLARADADCAAALKADARVLDYCLAFDLFATAVTPGVGRRDAESARLAQARAALAPGVDPAARLSQVRALMREASLGEASRQQAMAAKPPVRPSAPHPPARLATAASPRGPARHPAEPGAEQRRAEARAAVRALFARAEAAHQASKDADTIAQLYAQRTRPAPEEAPH